MFGPPRPPVLRPCGPQARARLDGSGRLARPIPPTEVGGWFVTSLPDSARPRPQSPHRQVGDRSRPGFPSSPACGAIENRITDVKFWLLFRPASGAGSFGGLADPGLRDPTERDRFTLGYNLSALRAFRSGLPTVALFREGGTDIGGCTHFAVANDVCATLAVSSKSAIAHERTEKPPPGQEPRRGLPKPPLIWFEILPDSV